jgi:phage gp36-like protein
MGIDLVSGDVITNPEVEDFISEASAIIDLYIRPKYKLPVTDATDLILLKHIASLLVVGKIDDILREKKSEESRFNRERNATKDAYDLLNKIDKNEVKLNSDSLNSPVHFSNKDYNGNVVKPFFQINNANPDNWE